LEGGNAPDEILDMSVLGGVEQMPFIVDWIDKDLHIYDSSISDPFPPEEVDAYFDAWYDLVENGPAPLFALFDISQWGITSSPSMGDNRFIRMRQYRKKIEVIAVVSTNRLATLMAKTGMAMLGHRSWMVFFKTQEEAVAYLKERATAHFREQESKAEAGDKK
jgi:hypothetical protein